MSLEPTFDDVTNPTPQEMTTWAYLPDADDPISQDWDVIATRPALASLFLALAADRECPKRGFFLGCLYLLAGDTVRTGFRTMPEADLLTLTNEASRTGETGVVTWAEHTRALVNAPESFGYAAWCTPEGRPGTPA